MSKITAIGIIVLSICSFSSCDDQGGSDRLKEKATLEAEVQARIQAQAQLALLEEQMKRQKELLEEQLKRERQNQEDLQDDQIKKERDALDSRAKQMENELDKRMSYYEQISGHYEGQMIRGDEAYNIRITMFPNIPRQTSDRTRLASEIELDLNSLALNIQVIQWIPGTVDSVGCRIEGLKLSRKKSVLNIISKDCPSAYYLNLNGDKLLGNVQVDNHSVAFEVNLKKIKIKEKGKLIYE